MDRHNEGRQENRVVAPDVRRSSPQLDEKWLESMQEKVKDTRRRLRLYQPSIAIGRVPRSIRQVDPEAYEPRMVSLGPYHRGKPHLKSAEAIKWQYLADFLSRNNKRSLKEYLERLMSVEEGARCTYSEDLEMKPNEFVEMLLLDGCFVVELFIKRIEGGGSGRKYEDPLVYTKWALTLVTVDMLMLENQLPFFVLERLYEMVTESCAPFAELAFDGLYLDGGFEMDKQKTLSRSKFHHLLHLFYSSVVPIDHARVQPVTHEVACDKSLLAKLCGSCSICLQPRQPLQDHGETVLCATKLRETGIKFRIKDKPASFQDIAFEDGWFDIPKIHVFNFTKYLLRNMIALEQCHQDYGNRVSTYAALMDCIINTADDVALLHKAKVVVNCLGDDAVAASLFNNLCTEVSAAFEGTYLSDVVEKVNKHSSSKMNEWTFKLHNNYFKTPWLIVSVMAAILLLLLTLLQTIFGILSYVSPQK